MCPTNKDCNSIQASIFKKHIEDTHPSINSYADPPEHTFIIEADITSSVATNAHKCRRPSRYVPYKGTFVPYDGTYGAPD